MGRIGGAEPIAPPEPDGGVAVEDIGSGVAAAAEAPVEVAKPAGHSDAVSGGAVSGGAVSFAGTWLYAPQPGDELEAGKYPATYVELVLVEHEGEIAGDYRARYKVPDQAVSPEVAFRIRGTAGRARSAKFLWSAGGQAKGQAEMTLRGPNVLYVSWWTTEFGRQATLASGTAVLIRQQAP